MLSVPFTVVWKLFDMGIGAIQAFIFALLTILYFDMAMAPDEEHQKSGDYIDATRPDLNDDNPTKEKLQWQTPQWRVGEDRGRHGRRRPGTGRRRRGRIGR